MPTFVIDYYGPNLSPMIAAWTAHYQRRGCTLTKARLVASNRVQRKSTWPPTLTAEEKK